MELERWIAIIAGVITISYVLPYIVKFVQFIVGSPFRKEILTGTWHAYHFTRMHGKTILRYEKWVIKRNLLNRLIIVTEDPKKSRFEL